MAGIVTMAVKDLRLLTRDRMGLFFIVGFPVLMGVAFGFIGASFAPGPSESNAMPVGVVDEDQSEMSRRFIQSLRNEGGIEVHEVGRDESRDLVRKRKLAGFIVVPPSFGETAGIIWASAPAIQLGVDPSRQAEAGMLQGYIMQAMGELVQERFTDTTSMRKQLAKSAASVDTNEEMTPTDRVLLKGFLQTADVFMGSLDTVMNRLDSGEDGGMPGMQLAKIETIDVLRPKSARGELLGKLRSQWDISFPAAMMWGVMACVAGFAVSIVKERTEGTLLRLKIAPITRAHILGGKALACFLSVVGVIIFMTVLGLLLGLQLASPPLLVLAGLSIAIGFVGLMMAMSVIGRTEQAVSGAAWAIIVVMCMFGGGMMPLAFLPRFMTTISHFSPVKWGILSLEGAIWRGFTLTEMLFPCGVLLAIGVAGFAIGVTVLTRQDG
jgi:ABC-2 type transport system permease protein